VYIVLAFLWSLVTESLLVVAIHYSLFPFSLNEEQEGEQQEQVTTRRRGTLRVMGDGEVDKMITVGGC
jgi:hypothetical protein